MNKYLKIIAFIPLAFLLLSTGAIAGTAYIVFMPEILTNKWAVSIALFLIYLLIEPFEKRILWNNKKEIMNELAPVTIMTLVGTALAFWTDIPVRFGFIFNA